MRKIVFFLIIAAFLLLILDASFAQRTRRSRTTPKAEKVKKKEEPKKNALQIMSFADSLLAGGDSTKAMELFRQVAIGFPKDTLAMKASSIVANYMIEHGNAVDAIKMLGSLSITDSTKMAERDLLMAKAYFSTGRIGYALLLARKAQVDYAGTDWENRAKAFANSLMDKIPKITIAVPSNSTQR